MTKIAYPFFTLGTDSIEATVWQSVETDGTHVPLQKYLEDWDYLKDIRVQRTIKISLDIASIQLGIKKSDLDLRVIVRIGTGPGNLPRAWIKSFEVRPNGADAIYVIDEIISGRSVSSRVRLETSIVSAAAPGYADELAPQLEAAKVWEHAIEVLLEGTEPRFPMEAISFQKMFPGRPHVSALWYLHWSPGAVHRDFGGAVRLYLNTDRQDFIERVTEGDAMLLQQMMAGVMGQITSSTLLISDAEQLLEQSEDGSIGGYVKHWLALAFPDESVTSLQSKMELRPGDFNAGILAVAEMGGVSE